MTKAEQETIYRYDQDERQLWLYTAYAADAERWRRLGFTVTEDGHGWRARGPVEALKLRRLGPNGQVRKRRQAPTVGFRPRAHMRSDDRSASGAAAGPGGTGSGPDRAS